MKTMNRDEANTRQPPLNHQKNPSLAVDESLGEGVDDGPDLGSGDGFAVTADMELLTVDFVAELFRLHSAIALC